MLIITSSCTLLDNHNKIIVTQEMIGGVTTEDMKKLFKCNYMLDFDENGYQIWKISYSNENKLFLFFNSKNVLENYKYIGDSKITKANKEIIDDLPYYIPRDDYLSREELKERLKDTETKPQKNKEEEFLKMLDKLLD